MIVKTIKSLFKWFYDHPVFMRPLIIFYSTVIKSGKIGLLRKLNPWLATEKNTMSFIPINVTLKKESEAAPLDIVHRLIDMATIHTVMEKCACRATWDCKEHDSSIGCLFMGETALSISPKTTKRITREEAHKHVERAVLNGLVPMIGKVRLDNFLFLERDKGKLMSMCFCCDCCCILEALRYLPADHLDDYMPGVEGVSIEVTDACKGCGACISHCMLHAIDIRNGRAVHSELCRRCGRCERVCPNGAVKITLTGLDSIDKAVNRLSELVDIQ
jgi:UDP-glucose 4-epimerase